MFGQEASMKITHNKVGQNLNTLDTGRTDKASNSDSKAAGNVANTKGNPLADLGASRVNVSDRAQQMKKAAEIARNVPDIDEAKVAKYQKLIDEGKYQVDAKAIADKMIDEEASWS
jgi:negative regulator of flagellin synthesis FlgM